MADDSTGALSDAALTAAYAPASTGGAIPSTPFGESDAETAIAGLFPDARITGEGRTAARNLQVGGVTNSMHRTDQVGGPQAVDFVDPKVTQAQALATIKAAGLPETEFFLEGAQHGQGAHLHWGWRPGPFEPLAQPTQAENQPPQAPGALSDADLATAYAKPAVTPSPPNPGGALSDADLVASYAAGNPKPPALAPAAPAFDWDRLSALGTGLKNLITGTQPLPNPKAAPSSIADTALKVAQNVPASLEQSAGGLVRAAGEITPEGILKAPMDLLAPGLNDLPAAAASIAGRKLPDVMPAWMQKPVAPGVAQTGADWVAAAHAHLAANAPNLPADSAQQLAYEAANGAVQMAPLFAASLITKSPAPVIAGFATQAYGDTYGASRAAGRTPKQAQLDATFSAAANALPAELPLHALMKPGETFMGKMFGTALAGAGQNMITTTLQTAYDAGILNKDMTWGDAVTAVAHSGLVGAAVGAGLGAGRAGIEAATGGPKAAAPGPISPQAPQVPENAPAPAGPVGPTQEPAPVGESANTPIPIKGGEPLNVQPANAISPPPTKNAQPVHDPITWTQVGWRDPKTGAITPLQPQGSPETAAATPAPETPSVSAAPVAPAPVPPVAASPLDLTAAKTALETNIDPATGTKPKGNAALRDFRARMQGIVDGAAPNQTPLAAQSSDGTNVAREAFGNSDATALPALPERASAVRGFVPEVPDKIPETVPPANVVKSEEALPPAHGPEFDAALADVHAARAPAPKVGADVMQVLRNAGGIKTTDSKGVVTPAGQNVREALLDYRRPGLINNRSGMLPDRAREFLEQRGWFGHYDTQQSNLEDLNDLLARGARGERVFHPESDAPGMLADQRMRAEELDRAGVGVTDPTEVAAQKLVAFRNSEQLPPLEAEHEAQVDEAVSGMSPSVRETIGTQGYEPGADADEGTEERPDIRAGEPESGALAEGPRAPAGRGLSPEGGEPAAEPGTREEELSADEIPFARRPAEEPGADDLPQTILPGAERSAKQLAEARESAGRGKKVTKADQQSPGGLFEEPIEDKQGTLFKKGEKPTGWDSVEGGASEPEVARPKRVTATFKFTDGFKEKRAAVGAGLRDRLNAFGLHDIGLKLPDAILAKSGEGDEVPSHADGAYANKIVYTALDAQRPHEEIVDHEAIHAMRALGLFTDGEWNALSAKADGWAKKYNIDKTYGDITPEKRTEEAIAHAYPDARAGRLEAPGNIVTRAFRKISNLFEAVGNAFRGNGFNSTDDVFGKVTSGEIGNRPRTEDLLPAELRAVPDLARRPGDEDDLPEEDRDPLEGGHATDPEGNVIASSGSPVYDNISDAIAEQTRGQGPSTSARGLAEISPRSGRQTKYLNIAETQAILPRTLAAQDTLFAKLFNAVRMRDEARNTNVTDLRETMPTFLGLSRADRDKVYAYEELRMLHEGKRTDAIDTKNMTAKNTGIPGAGILSQARYTKPGDEVSLDTPELKAAVAERRQMFDSAWDKVISATAKKLGWDGVPTAKAVQDAIAAEGTPAGKKSLGRTATLLQMMEEQRAQGYVPRMRFGDYYIAVRPKYTPEQATEENSPGGFPSLKRFEMVDSRTTADRILGRGAKPGVTPGPAADRIAELNAEFPPAQHDITHGYLFNKGDAMRKLDIPAIEKFLAIIGGDAQSRIEESLPAGLSDDERAAASSKMLDDIVEGLRDQMYEELKAGFKKRATIVPGYDGDFDRVTGAYVNWVSGHSANLEHGDEISRNRQMLADSHPDLAVRKYSDDWFRSLDERPSLIDSATRGARQAAFLYTLAANGASTAKIMLHAPMLGAPLLTAGTADIGSGPRLLNAMRQVSGRIRLGKGGIMIDPASATRDPAEKAMLKDLAGRGLLHQSGAEELAAMSHQGSASTDVHQKFWRKAMTVLSSNISAADVMNRTSMALAAMRSAMKPGALKKISGVWGNNEAFKAMVASDGLTPETFARFMVEQANGIWGARGRMPIARHWLGSMAVQFKNFEVNYLSNMNMIMRKMGPHGKLAGAMMLGGLGAMGGATALPMFNDLKSAGGWLYNLVTGAHEDMDELLATLAQDAGMSRGAAEMVLHGAPRALGVDMGSLGFGDIIGKETESPLDLIPALSIFAGAAQRAYERYGSGQEPLAAATEAMPNAVKNALNAIFVYHDQGLQSARGRQVLTPQQITPGMRVAKGFGFQPADISRAYEENEREYNAEEGHKQMVGDTESKIANLVYREDLARKAGDAAGAADLQAQIRDAQKAAAAAGIKMEPRAVRQKVGQHINPAAAGIRTMPKALRGKAANSPLVLPGDRRSEATPQDLNSVIGDPTKLQQAADAGLTWTPQQASRALNAAGMPATARLLRDRLATVAG